MVVHTRARELLAWLLPHLGSWPREQRHAVTQHVAALSMQLHDALIAASLREADIRLDQLRQYLHLAWHWRWMSEG